MQEEDFHVSKMKTMLQLTKFPVKKLDSELPRVVCDYSGLMVIWNPNTEVHYYHLTPSGHDQTDLKVLNIHIDIIPPYKYGYCEC